MSSVYILMTWTCSWLSTLSCKYLYHVLWCLSFPTHVLTCQNNVSCRNYQDYFINTLKHLEKRDFHKKNELGRIFYEARIFYMTSFFWTTNLLKMSPKNFVSIGPLVLKKSTWVPPQKNPGIWGVRRKQQLSKIHFSMRGWHTEDS